MDIVLCDVQPSTGAIGGLTSSGIEDWGKNPQPENPFLFRFVFVSCVLCVQSKAAFGRAGKRASSTLAPRHFLLRPELDLGLVCSLKKLMVLTGHLLERLRISCFALVALRLVQTYVWVLKKILDVNRQVDVIRRHTQGGGEQVRGMHETSGGAAAADLDGPGRK